MIAFVFENKSPFKDVAGGGGSHKVSRNARVLYQITCDVFHVSPSFGTKICVVAYRGKLYLTRMHSIPEGRKRQPKFMAEIRTWQVLISRITV